MMTRNKFLFYWKTNREWYFVDANRYPHLTEAAPELARESYRQYIERYTKLNRLRKPAIKTDLDITSD